MMKSLAWPAWGRRRGSGAAASSFASSTLAELAWQRTRRAASRAGGWGAALGALLALLAFAPAAWLAAAVASSSGERLQLADARGTVWQGSAILLLTGGPGSRDAAALPGRLHWSLVPTWRGIDLRLSQACCIDGTLTALIQPGFGRVKLILPPRGGSRGQWPAAWLGGLGAPWNTLQLGGMLRLGSTGLTLESVEGRWRLTGSAELDLIGVASRMSSLDSLGSYRIAVRGDAASGETATLSLQTLDGALRLTGSGQWAGSHLRFRGEARAAEGQEATLQNLLNIIGRRQGALSIISIG